MCLVLFCPITFCQSQEVDGSGGSEFGVCFVDTSVGTFHVSTSPIKGFVWPLVGFQSSRNRVDKYLTRDPLLLCDSNVALNSHCSLALFSKCPLFFFLTIKLGQFKDDHFCSKLRTTVSHYAPAEVRSIFLFVFYCMILVFSLLHCKLRAKAAILLLDFWPSVCLHFWTNRFCLKTMDWQPKHVKSWMGRSVLWRSKGSGHGRNFGMPRRP